MNDQKKYKVIKLNDLKKFCKAVLIKEGMNEAEAEITADVLSETDGYGTHSHGTKNLHNYIRKMRAGGININGNYQVIREGPGFVLLDADSSIGMVPARRAMKSAIDKAKECGISCALVRNATHFGAAGYYANMASEENMIGIVCSNVDANMTIPGAKGKVIGNNPIAYSVPAGRYRPIFLDIAMSTVASLKVIQAKKDGSSIPDTWITDADGLPTTDPGNYPEIGAMQPMAAHKGYGIALLVELLTGVLSGGGVMKDVPSWLFNMESKNDVSHTFIAIDISKFMDINLYCQRVENVIDTLHTTPLAKGTDRIYYPGEIEWERYERTLKEGLLLPKDVEESLNSLHEESGVDICWK